MLAYNEVKERKYIIYEHEPYEVLTSHVFRKQQRKPVNATKLRNLLSGRVVEVSFQVSDKVEEADIEKRPTMFIYSDPRKGEFWFHPEGKPGERFTLSGDTVGTASRWLKSNTLVDALVFSYDGEEKIIGVSLPIKIDFVVKEAQPATKGNTVQGAMKTVKLDNGVEIQVPMFINEGDVVKINTDTGTYVERVEKN